MKHNAYKKGFGWVVIVGLFFVGIRAAHSEIPIPVGLRKFSQESVYQFHQHLQNCETWAVDTQKRYVKGKWIQDGYEFENIGPRAKIQKVVVDVDGERRQSIRFNPLQGIRRHIRFMNVKPGSTLFLAYGMDLEEDPKKLDYVDFQVYLGSHLLRHFRIPIQSGWTSEDIELGVAGFWDRDLNVTFEIYTNSSERAFFSFNAEVIS